MKYQLISCLVAILFCCNGRATTVNAYMLNREGIKKLDAKAFFPAYQNFVKGLDDDPLNPELHMNIGLSLELNEEYEKAEQAYRSALSLMPETQGKQRFAALFNLAGVQAKQKKIPEALASYQAALEIDPESKEVKTMIELLWQGGGQGDGESKEDQQEGDQGKGRPKEQDSNERPDQPKQNKKQPRPFQSENLTPQDVKKILDEIKNQEQGIRAQENDKGAKDAPRGKDW